MYPILLSSLRSTYCKVRHMSWVGDNDTASPCLSSSRKMRAVVQAVQRRPECWRAGESESV